MVEQGGRPPFFVPERFARGASLYYISIACSKEKGILLLYVRGWCIGWLCVLFTLYHINALVMQRTQKTPLPQPPQTSKRQAAGQTAKYRNKMGEGGGCD